MRLKDKNILVTGAAGFIGSHLTDQLLEEGAIVYGIDNLVSGDLINLEIALQNPNFTFKQGDIRDKDFLISSMKDIDVIFHLAAFTSVKQSIILPEECNNINVTGTLNMLEIARKFDVRKFIYSSSAAVYGDTQQLPVGEDVPPKPKSPYGISKFTAEQYVLLYNQLFGIQTTALRYFNVFGPRQKLSEYSGVIMIFLENIKNHRDFIIYGDGNHTRDFIYVSDVVLANILAYKSSKGGEIYNIATGVETSIQNLAEMMLELAHNIKNKIIHAKANTGDIVRSCANIDKVRNQLNFQPICKVREGLRIVMDWYSYGKNRDLRSY